MHYLKPVYHNSIGGTYILTSDLEDNTFEKIQLQLAELSILMTIEDLSQLLKTINSARQGCQCKNCGKKHCFKLIKCDTTFAQLHFKTTKKNVNALEELIQGTLFELAMEDLLAVNEIN